MDDQNQKVKTRAIFCIPNILKGGKQEILFPYCVPLCEKLYSFLLDSKNLNTSKEALFAIASVAVSLKNYFDQVFFSFFFFLFLIF